jgi:hypothetical protein
VASFIFRPVLRRQSPNRYWKPADPETDLNSIALPMSWVDECSDATKAQFWLSIVITP